MKTSGRWLLVLSCAVLLARPGLASADVVPVRKAKSDKAASKVEARLVSMGVPAPDASACVGSLTASELGFFAGDSRRVQSVGGLAMEEWLAGGAVIVVTGLIYFSFISNGN